MEVYIVSKLVANSVLVIGIVQAAIAVGVAFGLNLTDAQSGGIIGLFGAIFALGGAWYSPSLPGGPKKVAP